MRIRHVVAAALVSTLAVALPAMPAQAVLRWSSTDVGTTSQIGSADSMVSVEHDGVRTVAWISEGDVLARQARGGKWGETTTLSQGSSQVRLFGAVDASGTVTIAWAQNNGAEVRVQAARHARTWGPTVTVVPNIGTGSLSWAGLSLAAVGDRTFLGVTSATIPHEFSVWSATGRASTWQPMAVPPGVSDQPGTLQLFTAAERLGATWTQDPGGETRLAFFAPDAGAWSDAQLIQGGMPVAAPPLVAVGGSDGAVVVWGRYDIASATRTWRYLLVDGDDVGASTDLMEGMPNSARPTVTWSAGTAWILGPASPDVSAHLWARGATESYVELATPGVIAHSYAIATDDNARPMVTWLASEPGVSVMMRATRLVGSSWQDDFEAVGARAGGAVSAGAPTVVWQKAQGSAGRGSVVVSSYLDVPLDVPTLTKLRLKDKRQVTVRWQPPTDSVGVEGYVVQVRKGRGAWQVKHTAAVGERTWTFTAAAGATYRVRVAAAAPGERSAWSPARSITIPKPPPRPTR